MAKTRHRVFDFIAPVYGLFFNFQVNYYQKILDRIKDEFDLDNYKKIIDIGCGTGALCHVLSQRGFRVTGIDAAEKMIKVAGRKLANSAVDLYHADVLERTPFPDKSFDVAISSYTAHGLDVLDRRKMYAEMGRLAKCWVIFHDYNNKRAPHITLAEKLEGGNYFSFIKNARVEMAEIFKSVHVVNVDLRAAWYICTPHEEGWVRGIDCHSKRGQSLK